MSTIWTHLAACSTPSSSSMSETYGRESCDQARAAPRVCSCTDRGGHLEVFARNIAALSEFHRVVAIDLFGHGFTSNTGGKAQNWDSLANHVLNTLDRLGIDESIWIGEALGAQLVEWVALTAPPERLAGGSPHQCCYPGCSARVAALRRSPPFPSVVGCGTRRPY